MKIKQAGMEQFETIQSITTETIKEVYPHYYPKGAVDFFLKHHSDEHIRKDILDGRVFLIYSAEGNAAGTVTVKENEICRLFVLPSFQGQGFGRELLRFAEETILEQYGVITLDASLPAKTIYKKRGYVETKSHSIQTQGGDFLCYDVMQKTMK